MDDHTTRRLWTSPFALHYVVRGTGKDPDSPTNASGQWLQLSLGEMLLRPVCVELLHDALYQIHSEENLVFYLHVTCYRRLANDRLRSMLANDIYGAFIR